MVVAFLSLTVLVSCSNAQDDEPVESPNGYFVFYVDPWNSLHHFVFHLARDNAVEVRLRGRVPITPEDREAMTPEFVVALDQAFAAYEPYLDTSLLFDDETRRISEQLMDGPEALDDPDVRAALTSLMPIYLETVWPRHKAASEALRTELMQQLELHEEELAQRLAQFLESEWPADPIRVDLTAYANRVGAYTFDPPPHITLSSYDEDLIGELGFEILFHEATHTARLGANLMPAADRALAAAGLSSDRFWHYALFYISGQITSEVIGEPDYEIYAAATGLTSRPSSAHFYEAFADNWSTSDGLDDFLTRSALQAAEAANAAEQD